MTLAVPRLLILLAALAGLTLAGGHAISAPAGAKVRFEISAPRSPEDETVAGLLAAQGWLEPIRAQLDVFRLVRPITVRIRSCPGRGQAWYEDDTVTVCYRYLANIVRNAARPDRPEWVSQEQAIAGGVVDVFFHEFGHALFEQHNIPLLGREEDAADQLAAFMMLGRRREEAASLVKGTAYIYLRWLQDYGDGFRHDGRTLSTGARAYSAEPHASSAQRFYNLVCLAYGANQALFKDLARAADLPEDRAEGCEDEYGLVANAWKRLIAPLVDERLALRAHGTSLIAPFKASGG